MKKLPVQWVPRMLTIDYKCNRLISPKECLRIFSRNPNEILRRFITVDETWIHHTTPEGKQQSKQWISTNEGAPKKTKMGQSVNKVMSTLFWNLLGVIRIDDLVKSKTITGEYCPHPMDRFDTVVKQKRSHGKE